jgi:hypothetical protein
MAKRFSLQDASGSYSWITENCDNSDYQDFSDSDIRDWVNSLIDTTSFEAELEDAAEQQQYPRYGYWTSQVFENEDEWLTFKKAEMLEDVESEREAAFNYLKQWIAEVEAEVE